MSEAEVNITTDSNDTDNSRHFKHYAALHFPSTMRFEPGPGPSTPASVEETDGWYIDLPGLGCQDRASTGFAFLAGGPRIERWQFKWLGKAARGYPIE